jgi:hypothetical protein
MKNASLSIMAATGLEVGRDDNYSANGDFSANGAVMVSRTQLGHLLVFHVDDGTVNDFGYSPDNGRISSDRSLLAHLVYRVGCAVPQPSDDLDILCFDIYVSSSDGRTRCRSATGCASSSTTINSPATTT